MQRFWRMMVAVGVMLGLILNSTVVGFAQEVPAKGLTARDAVIKDAQGKIRTHTEELPETLTYTVNYQWSIDNRVKVQAGDTITVTLPANVKIPEDDSFVMENTGLLGTKPIGTFFIAKGSHTGIITLNQTFANTKLNRKGFIRLEVVGGQPVITSPEDPNDTGDNNENDEGVVTPTPNPGDEDSSSQTSSSSQSESSSVSSSTTEQSSSSEDQLSSSVSSADENDASDGSSSSVASENPDPDGEDQSDTGQSDADSSTEVPDSEHPGGQPEAPEAPGTDQSSASSSESTSEQSSSNASTSSSSTDASSDSSSSSTSSSDSSSTSTSSSSSSSESRPEGNQSTPAPAVPGPGTSSSSSSEPGQSGGAGAGVTTPSADASSQTENPGTTGPATPLPGGSAGGGSADLITGGMPCDDQSNQVTDSTNLVGLPTTSPALSGMGAGDAIVSAPFGDDQADQATLPQTGERTPTGLVYLGGGLLVGLVGWYWFRRRQER